MNKEKLMAIIEGILFIYGDEGISLMELETVLDHCKPSEIKSGILDLEAKYKNDDSSSLAIQKFGINKYRMQTKNDLHEWFAKLEVVQSQSKLSNSSIEVLSIIAYKGPITKTRIDDIRQSDSSYQLYKLKDKKLIRSIGKDEENNRANLYSITENFFKLFNIVGGKESLPKISDEEIAEEVEKNRNSNEVNGKDIFGENVFFGEE
ncbi:chromosome condensation and segregation factor B [Williamsoniiplasma somnilux]|uniref:Chromosome condensation and segregation factor B n=1 Tax=Williamsoniiplasma somnilux TaxID=215578 RepID=A0A2K8NYE0_9MOLU|nr:SMC-Scp complex subunit ScpB [Williamsoniiplasma somnilux]ATZ18852.1 chromosome condensation and segregation factor B [Williamsoniiplasma somnilux]